MIAAVPSVRERIIGRLFLVAGGYGLLVLLPLYVTPHSGLDGRQLQYRYGFAGAAGATQLLYLIIAADPRRYRPMMLVGVVSKLSFIIPCALLVAHGLLGGDMLLFGAIDAVLAFAFLVSWRLLARATGTTEDAAIPAPRDSRIDPKNMPP